MQQLSAKIRTHFLSVILLLAAMPAQASINTVDLVRVKSGHIEEAVYYYEQNWKKFREDARAAGYILGYRLLVDRRLTGQETLLLITEYADEEQYARREENFALVMEASNEGGIMLLNEVEPGEFREVVDLGVFESD